MVTEFETPKELEIPPALAPASDDTVEVAELLLDHWYELAFAHEPVKYLTVTQNKGFKGKLGN